MPAPPPPVSRDPLLRVTSTGSGLVALHAAAALFGLAGLFGKWLALAPATIVGGRALIAAATLALVARWLKVATKAVDAKLVASGMLLALHWFAFFEAIRVATVAVGLVGFASFPLFVLVIEGVASRARLHAMQALSALLVSGGLLVVATDASLGSASLQGLAWGVLTGASFAGLTVANLGFAQDRHPLDIARWQNAVAALAMIPWLPWTTALLPKVTDLAGLAFLGIVCTALAHTLFIAGVRARSAHTASIVVALEPVYGAAFAFVLLGEHPSAHVWVGGAMIVVACGLQGWRGQT